MRSVIDGDEINVCFLCGQWTWTPEVHHCLHGTGRRKLAEQDGLKVTLCPECHRKLHDKGFGDRYLQELAEDTWLKRNNATVEDFIRRYGKNYKEE